MQQSFPGINPDIAEWKGQEITDFQEDLRLKVNGQLSEKWFYNHMKSGNASLPRIDVLNLLSRYAGYANWDDFVFKNGGSLAKRAPISTPGVTRANKFFIMVPALALLLTGLFAGFYFLISSREYTLRFYDSVTREPIRDTLVQVTLFFKNESPRNYFSDTNGIIRIRTGSKNIRFAVSAPYYRNDTISRIVKSFDREQSVGMDPDEFAMLIHYISETRVADWQKRRLQLNRMIDDRALIYQVLDHLNAPAMEIFTKDEFIDRLTMPTGSLKHLEIMDTKLREDKIMLLKFRIRDLK